MSERPSTRLLVAALGSALLLGCTAPETSAVGGMEDVAPSPSATPPAAVTASTDTAGIGVRIATAFPGWRLSTEAEVAGRFPLIDGSTPQTHWKEWGSGRAWWVWDGDFDGDGKQDRLAILTNAATPAEDKLVVLHGDGTHADLGGLGGWGVGITRKGEELWGTLLKTDAIAKVFWEKGADVLVWNSETRTYVVLERECC